MDEPLPRKEKIAVLSIIALLFLTLADAAGVIVVTGSTVGAPQFPQVRSVGALTGKAGTLLLGSPDGYVDGDLLIAFIETANEPITLSGWTEAPCSPTSRGSSCPGDPDCTRLTVFYKADCGVGCNWTTSDSGNHQIGGVIAITKDTFNAADPFDTCTTNNENSRQEISIWGSTTTIADTRVLAGSAGDTPDKNGTSEFSAPTNANLGSVSEQMDVSKNPGNGGALLLITGTLDSAGAVGTTEATAVTYAARANIQLTINSKP